MTSPYLDGSDASDIEQSPPTPSSVAPARQWPAIKPNRPQRDPVIVAPDPDDALADDKSNWHNSWSPPSFDAPKLDISPPAEPLANWVADYIWAICSFDPRNPISSRTIPNPTPLYLPDAVQNVLQQTQLPPTAIFLALYYIQKLPVTFIPSDLYPPSSPSANFRLELFAHQHHKAPYRLFVLGIMLANKWLEDNTFTNKTWHDVTGLPLAEINRVELLALGLLQFDLSISDAAWREWLATLRKYHVALPAPSASTAPQHTHVLTLIDAALRDVAPVTPKNIPEVRFAGRLAAGDAPAAASPPPTSWPEHNKQSVYPYPPPSFSYGPLFYAPFPVFHPAAPLPLPPPPPYHHGGYHLVPQFPVWLA